MKSPYKLFTAALTVGALVLGMPNAHAENGPMQRAGRAIDHAAKKTGEGIGKAMQKTGEALNKAGEKTGEALGKAGRKVEQVVAKKE